MVVFLYKSPQENDFKDFISSIPEPFVDDQNFKVLEDFFTGKCKKTRPAMLHVDGVSRYADNFSCGGATYYDGKRITIPTLKEYKRTIHIFGGSTVWGSGSTDENTIPSLLAINFESAKIRVLNYGLASYVSSQQNSTLRAFHNEVKANDIVIYYDGGNDFWNGVMLGNAAGSIVGYNVENQFDVYFYIIKKWLSQNLATYKFLSDLKHKRKKNLTKTCRVAADYAANNVPMAAHHYASQIEQANLLVESKSAKFYHFLQPTLFDIDNLTEYENEVLSRDPCWSVARSVKEEFDAQFLAASPSTKDLSEAFNNKNVFYDYIHVSAKGNKLIVENILNEITIN